MPEAALARELGVHYAALCPIVNQAAGRGKSSSGINFADVSANLESAMQKICLLIEEIAHVYKIEANQMEKSQAKNTESMAR